MMTFKSLARTTGTLALAAAAVLAVSPAHAASHILNLTGTVGNSSFGNFTIGSSEFFTWTLNLDGLQAFEINQGDDVQVSVTLDQLFTVPSSGETFVGFNLFQDNGSVNPSNASNNGSWTFLNSMGPTGLANDTVGSNCGNCLSNIVFLGAQSSFNFDGITANFTIDTLDDVDFLINGASLSYQLRNTIPTVPEPSTWAMMLLGFGAVGSAIRRRTKVAVTCA
jgi:hypothetical protein